LVEKAESIIEQSVEIAKAAVELVGNAKDEFEALDTFGKVKAVALSMKIVNTAKNVPLTIKSIIDSIKNQKEEAKAAVLIL
jgi:hypothetical protein